MEQILLFILLWFTFAYAPEPFAPRRAAWNGVNFATASNSRSGGAVGVGQHHADGACGDHNGQYDQHTLRTLDAALKGIPNRLPADHDCQPGY